MQSNRDRIGEHAFLAKSSLYLENKLSKIYENMLKESMLKVIQEATMHFEQTADSDNVSTYQVSSSFLSVTNCTKET